MSNPFRSFQILRLTFVHLHRFCFITFMGLSNPTLLEILNPFLFLCSRVCSREGGCIHENYPFLPISLTSKEKRQQMTFIVQSSSHLHPSGNYHASYKLIVYSYFVFRFVPQHCDVWFDVDNVKLSGQFKT